MWSVDALNDVASRWVELAWTVVWQSTILAAIVALVVLAFRRSSPEVRYWLWQMVAIKLLLMPFWTVAVPVLTDPDARPRPGGPVKDRQTGSLVADVGPEQTSAESRAVHWEQGIAAEVQEPVRARRPAPPGGSLALPDTPAAIDIPEHLRVRAVAPSPPATDFAAPDSHPAPPPTRQIRWQAWLGLFWLMIVAAQIARLLIQRIRLGRLLSSARPADPRLTVLVIEAAATLSLSRVPRAVLIDRETSPFVCGVRRPVVAMPAVVREALAEAQLRQVLLHELAHVKRRDLLWGWIPEIARGLYFFHPVAHWVRSRIRLERELACDRLAMAASGADAGEYAETLVRAVSFGSRPVVFRSGAVHCGYSSQLSPFWRRRIAMLPLTRASRPVRSRHWITLSLASIALIGVPTFQAISVPAQESAVQRNTDAEPPAELNVSEPAPKQKTEPSDTQRSTELAPSRPVPRERPLPSVSGTALASGGGGSLDLVHLANSYIEAMEDVENTTRELKRAEQLHRTRAVSVSEFARTEAAARHAKIRADLLRRILEVAEKSTADDVRLLTKEVEFFDILRSTGGISQEFQIEEFAARRRLNEAKTRLEILQAILSIPKKDG